MQVKRGGSTCPNCPRIHRHTRAAKPCGARMSGRRGGYANTKDVSKGGLWVAECWIKMRCLHPSIVKDACCLTYNISKLSDATMGPRRVSDALSAHSTDRFILLCSNRGRLCHRSRCQSQELNHIFQVDFGMDETVHAVCEDQGEKVLALRFAISTAEECVPGRKREDTQHRDSY